MRRFIIQKRANSQELVEKDDIEKFLIEAQTRVRPQSSYKDFETGDSPYVATESSNASLINSTRADKCFIDTSEEKSTVRVQRIQELISHSFDACKKTRHKNVQKKAEFCIKGRPLTAYSVYSSKRKIESKFQMKKRSSVITSTRNESFNLSDPKLFDEEYTSMDDYTKMIWSERKTSPRHASQNVIPEKSNEDFEKSLIIPVPVVVKASPSPQKRIGLVVTTKLGLRTHGKSSISAKGKIFKGMSVRPSIPRNKKMFHSILIS